MEISSPFGSPSFASIMFTTILLLLFSVIFNDSGSFSKLNLTSERVFQFMVTSSQFVKWNDEKDFGNLIVSVVDDEPLEKLISSRTKMQSSRKRKIEYRPFSWLDATSFHVIYVGKVSPDTQLRLIELARKHKIVLIGHEKNQEQGPYIHLFSDDNKLRYELDEFGLASSGIEVDPTLKRIAARSSTTPN